ncbi:MAG: protein phosphatase 2C domain-containing protein [Spirochaetales bacterium]|jgi:hypothetical protein|nr:protein phosphatase 2C domain-containing protein [Spirochaetales bacterium]
MVEDRRAFACSAPGASHIKQGRPSQDYALSYEEEGLRIVAVADGHGSAPHFRSDRGARFACVCALKRIKDLASAVPPCDGMDAALAGLELDIVMDWNEAVIEDWNQGPPDSGEIISEEMMEGVFNPPVAYGTTLIAAALILPGSAGGGRWFGIQIGDGRCVVLDTEGGAAQPVPWDEDCCFNATTSLCDLDAAERFRHFYSPEGAPLPAALFLGTDGVDNSYPVYENEKHLSGLYQRIYDNFIAEGFAAGKKQLEEFLPRFSEKGSRDDVSIGGIISL